MDHQPQSVVGGLACRSGTSAFQKVQRLPHLFIKNPTTFVEDHPVGPPVKKGHRQFLFQPLDALGDVGGRHLIFFGGFGEVFGKGGVAKIGQLQKFHKTPRYHHLKHIVGYVI